VSKAFRKAADRRLSKFNRIDVRVYNGISELSGRKCERDVFEWHPHAAVMLVETGPTELGIAIDKKMTYDDVRALVQVLSTFRQHVEQIFVDGPIIELLVSQINKQQLTLLMEQLRLSRKIPHDETKASPSKRVLVPVHEPHMPHGPFFPKLKKLTITSQSNQLEHLSRLLSYAVGVGSLYESENIDLLCLKICIGGHWCHKRHTRMFRHVTRFRQWTEADSLGERYFQQFTGGRQKPPHY
jgi:hypothetical protein